MHKELLSNLIKSFEEDYNGDLDLFLNDIRANLETYQTEKKLSEKKPTNTNVVIKISNLSKEYSIGKERIKALQDINLEIYEGEIVALVGPSGSGKSTLLNIIGGLDTDISGDISIASKSLKQMDDTTLSSYRNQTIGFIFQFFNLQPYLNVQENVEIPLLFRGEKEEIRNKASNQAVSSVGLSERITHLPNQLSGGQMQRVAIARAIVNQPKIILADEPTGNLDRNTGIEIVKLIKQINRDLNTTVVIVTHDNFVANQADRIIKLSDGKLV